MTTADLTPTDTHVQRARATTIHWARVQAWSGLLFAAFAIVHLLNTMLAALGPAAYNGFQRAVRPIYQYPAVEALLVLGPLLLHMLAGVMRMRGRSGGAPTGLRPRLHRYAGYFLLVFILGHVGATRVPVWLYGAYPEFEGLAFTFQFAPYWFYAYYPLLALAGVVHLLIGVPLALSVVGPRVPMALRRGPALWGPMLAVGGLVLLGLAGMGGLLYELPDYADHPFAKVLIELTDEVIGG